MNRGSGQRSELHRIDHEHASMRPRFMNRGSGVRAEIEHGGTQLQ